MNRQEHYRHFVAQKYLIEKHFPAFRCRLHRGHLECVGDICPSPESTTYTVRIRYSEWGIPEVRVLAPVIRPRPEIHMYKDGRMCLYHPPTQPWSSRKDLHSTILKWTAEWVLYHELFLTEKRWLGPEVPHGSLS